MNNIEITIVKTHDLSRFLITNGFTIEDLGNDVFSVRREDELPVFVKIEDNSIYFEADLGNISAISNEELLFQLLDLNTEILPVSLGINNSNPADPRLVLVESRETGSLNDHEVLSVFDTLELAVEKVAPILAAKLATV